MQVAQETNHLDDWDDLDWTWRNVLVARYLARSAMETWDAIPDKERIQLLRELT